MSSSDKPYGLLIAKDILLPMRDGVRLATDVYLPAREGQAVEGKWPTILMRTPYGKNGGKADAVTRRAAWTLTCGSNRTRRRSIWA